MQPDMRPIIDYQEVNSFSSADLANFRDLEPLMTEEVIRPLRDKFDALEYPLDIQVSTTYQDVNCDEPCREPTSRPYPDEFYEEEETSINPIYYVALIGSALSLVAASARPLFNLSKEAIRQLKSAIVIEKYFLPDEGEDWRFFSPLSIPDLIASAKGVIKSFNISKITSRIPTKEDITHAISDLVEQFPIATAGFLRRVRPDWYDRHLDIVRTYDITAEGIQKPKYFDGIIMQVSAVFDTLEGRTKKSSSEWEREVALRKRRAMLGLIEEEIAEDNPIDSPPASDMSIPENTPIFANPRLARAKSIIESYLGYASTWTYLRFLSLSSTVRDYGSNFLHELAAERKLKNDYLQELNERRREGWSVLGHVKKGLFLQLTAQDPHNAVQDFIRDNSHIL